MGLSSSSVRCVVFILILLCICKSHAQKQVFNIMQFGAKSDGVTDNISFGDTHLVLHWKGEECSTSLNDIWATPSLSIGFEGLSMAWSKACGYKGAGVVLIPQGKFLVLPVMLQGPCNGLTQLQIDGQLLAPTGMSSANSEYWLAINQVNNLVVDGQGSLDGRGPSVWSSNRCTNSCSGFPVTLSLDKINRATIKNIKSMDSKFFHFKVYGSQDITFDDVTVLAPENSPNTDGIHISTSSGINIMHSMIGTGDDCISLGPGSRDVNITNVNCGPGHGISIGSLGRHQDEADVTGVIVRDSIFSNTMNGVRIKSLSSPFSSVVDTIKFINLQMNNVKNPIIIDQNYCPHDSCDHNKQGSSRVQIQNVKYEGIRGSSSTQVAVDFDCSQVVPCQGIELQDINLSFNGAATSATSVCHNVRGSTFGQQLPPSCL